MSKLAIVAVMATAWAVWMLVHARLIVLVWKDRDTRRGARWLAILFPPSTPFLSWRRGRRWIVLLWCGLLVTYVTAAALGLFAPP